MTLTSPALADVVAADGARRALCDRDGVLLGTESSVVLGATAEDRGAPRLSPGRSSIGYFFEAS